MVLIYSHTTSPRLQYICKFIFENVLNVGFKITIDSEEFRPYSGVCINYSDRKIKDEELRVENVKLLFEENITQQKIECFTAKDYKAFFKIENSDFGFDIFAASFYFLSRYEEYLPYKKDVYGRYSHENSLAFKEGFLLLPLINIWIKDFALCIKKKYSIFNIQYSIFKYVPTYDIDMAYSYKHKGVIRNIGGFFKNPSVERIKVLLGLQKDPFDNYDWINALHTKYNLNALYFFLLAEKTSRYDKNIALHKNAMWRLIKLHAKKYNIGIHPSWQSANNISILKKEKSYLEAMSELTITNSRQHFIKFNLPEGYRQLIEAGITDDYSMGYGSINGFRASVATSFNWFDLENNEETNLCIHPFCFMDANSHYEQKQTAQQSFDELMNYYKICKEVGGTLITIFHNNFLGTDKNFKGWREIYEKFINSLRSSIDSKDNHPFEIEIYNKREKVSTKIYVTKVSDNIFKSVENEFAFCELTLGTEFQTRINNEGKHEIVKITKKSNYTTKRFFLTNQFTQNEFMVLGDEIIKNGGYWQVDFGGIATINLPENSSLDLNEIFSTFNFNPLYITDD